MRKYLVGLWNALLGKAEVPPVAAPERFRDETVAMRIAVDTTDLKAALELLECIATEATKVNASLEAMRARGVSVVAE
jgi:hypothetical protein